MFRWKAHWPNDTPIDNLDAELTRFSASEGVREKGADLRRCGHLQTKDGTRVYPGGYVVLSELDILRIAERVVGLLAIRFRETVEAGDFLLTENNPRPPDDWMVGADPHETRDGLDMG